MGGAGCLCSQGDGHSTERSKSPELCQGARAHSLQSSWLLSKTCKPFNYTALQAIFSSSSLQKIYIDDHFPSNVFQSALHSMN